MSSKRTVDLVVRFAVPMSDIETIADIAWDVERLLGHYLTAKHIDVFFRPSPVGEGAVRPYPADDDPDCQDVERRFYDSPWAVDYV